MKKTRTILIAVALVIIGFMGAKLLERGSNVKVSATSIEERLSKCSSLTTARLDYRGIVNYSDGDIQFITKKSFSMIYDSHIKAGIDLSKAQVRVDGKKIKITVPKPDIQDIIIDSDTLEFYDEKLALFNWTDKTDTAKAIEFAKQDATAKVDQTDILSQASKHAKTVIETFIMPITDNGDNSYQLEFIQQ